MDARQAEEARVEEMDGEGVTGCVVLMRVVCREK